MLQLLGSLFFYGFTVLSGFDQPSVDSIPVAQGLESDSSAEAQENEFQNNNVNPLFEAPLLDTFAWNTRNINSGHFDPGEWLDTAKIVLVDSSQGMFFAHPFKNQITSNFGPRGCIWHYGVDIGLVRGDTVRAAFDGIVRISLYDKYGFGIVVVLRHAGGLETIYGHLSKTALKPNQVVKAGEVIGLGGRTGHATGSHLHFEMRYLGEPFDPNWIIDFSNYTLKCDTLVLTKANFDYLSDMQKVTWHTIRKGETLRSLARRYHTTIGTLCRINHITARTLLAVGKRLALQSQSRMYTGPIIMLQQKKLQPES